MNLGKLISPVVKFKTKKFNDLKDRIGAMTVSTTTEVDINFEHDNTIYNIKSGGLHSDDKPAVFNANDKIVYREADGASFYPSLTINNKVAPKHLDKDIFINVTIVMVNDRLEAKAIGDKTKADGLKISINVGLFGKFGFAYSFLFDLLCTMTITINGQLQLLMLVEDLSLIGIKTISANTDGIVIGVRPDQEVEYMRVCDEWAKNVNIVLEHTDYAKYVRRDVNNYLTIKKVYYDVRKHSKMAIEKFDKSDDHGKFYFDVKRKGDLNQFLYREDLKKGFNMPIVAKAVEEYFVNDVPVRDTIMNELNIYSFCATQNVGRKYKLEHHVSSKGIVTTDEVQRNIRFFLSTDGGYLYKVEKLDNLMAHHEGNANEIDKYIGIMAGQAITIFNDYFYKPIADYNIDYSYYVLKAQTLINGILVSDTSKTSKGKKARSNMTHTGNLFEDMGI
jgi:hypothetical protein